MTSMTCRGTQHGTANAYNNHRCRCPEARRAANRDRERRKLNRLNGRPHLASALGTNRRLRALVAIGWSQRELARRIGTTEQYVADLLKPRTPYVHRRTVDRVARLYAELADTPGPSVRARNKAAALGWLPPVWWDDDTIDDPGYTPPLDGDDVRRGDVDPVVVERALDGRAPRRLTRAERLVVVEALTASGRGAEKIGQITGVTRRQVVRDRDDLGCSLGQAS